jgi:hypothetical protein
MHEIYSKINLCKGFLPCGIQEQCLASILICYWFSLFLSDTTNSKFTVKFFTFTSTFLFLHVRRYNKPGQWLIIRLYWMCKLYSVKNIQIYPFCYTVTVCCLASLSSNMNNFLWFVPFFLLVFSFLTSS